MNINYDEYDDDDSPTYERIRRGNGSENPVNGRHDMQRRAENGKNRSIKALRRQKEQDRSK
jgi:hypothetical protein